MVYNVCKNQHIIKSWKRPTWLKDSPSTDDEKIICNKKINEFQHFNIYSADCKLIFKQFGPNQASYDDDEEVILGHK